MTAPKVYSTVVLIIAMCCAHSPAVGEDVTARARVDSTKYLIGDWITVKVDITHPKGASFRRLVGDTLGGFSVISRDSLERISETQTATKVVVARYDSGTALLPPIPFLCTFAGDTASRIIATNPLLFTVNTVKVDTTQEIKDVKPPLSIPLTLAEIALYLGIFLAAAAAAYVMYRYWKKRKQKPAGEAYVPPPRPAHLIALEELAVLKEKRLWQQGLIKQYYSAVTEVVRRYFENRYSIMALEQTTDEIMEALRQHRHAETIWEETELILRRADLVKFAKQQPGIPEHEEMLTVVYDIVDKTKLVEALPSTEKERRVPVDVVP